MRMRIDVVTIFPEFFGVLDVSLLGKARQAELVETHVHDLRDYAAFKADGSPDVHRTVDDAPFGGGAGMVMKPEPLAEAIRTAKKSAPSSRTVLMTPQGRRFSQPMAHELAGEEGIIFVCGRYEGVDERVFSRYIDDEISVGDYVLTGGELPAMIVMDAVTRLLPGVLGGEDSAEKDSFSAGLLEHAHYTRPREFEGEAVPEVLLSGNHQAIARWRTETSLIRTFLKRPDLLARRHFAPDEVDILRSWCADIERIIETQPVSGAGPLPGRE